MSGGSWNYFYGQLEDVAMRLSGQSCPFRRALGAQLSKSATALRDIEWVDSGDMSDGDDIRAIKAALGPDHKAAAMAEIKAGAEKAIADLTKAMEAIK